MLVIIESVNRVSTLPPPRLPHRRPHRLDLPVPPPICSTYFFWELGCLRYLHRQFDLTKVQLVGASAGGLIATLAACGVDEDRAVRAGWGWAGRGLHCFFTRCCRSAAVWNSVRS